MWTHRQRNRVQNAIGLSTMIGRLEARSWVTGHAPRAYNGGVPLISANRISAPALMPPAVHFGRSRSSHEACKMEGD